LLFDIAVDLIGEIFDGELVITPIAIQNALRGRHLRPGSQSIGLRNVLRLQESDLTAPLPRLSRHVLIGVPERDILTTTIQIPFKFGDVGLFAVIPGHLIKHFDEHREQGVNLGFRDYLRFLINVEQDGFGGYGNSPLEVATQDFVILAFG